MGIAGVSSASLASRGCPLFGEAQRCEEGLGSSHGCSTMRARGLLSRCFGRLSSDPVGETMGSLPDAAALVERQDPLDAEVAPEVRAIFEDVATVRLEYDAMPELCPVGDIEADRWDFSFLSRSCLLGVTASARKSLSFSFLRTFGHCYHNWPGECFPEVRHQEKGLHPWLPCHQRSRCCPSQSNAVHLPHTCPDVEPSCRYSGALGAGGGGCVRTLRREPSWWPRAWRLFQETEDYVVLERDLRATTADRIAEAIFQHPQGQSLSGDAKVALHKLVMQLVLQTPGRQLIKQFLWMYCKKRILPRVPLIARPLIAAHGAILCLDCSASDCRQLRPDERDSFFRATEVCSRFVFAFFASFFLSLLFAMRAGKAAGKPKASTYLWGHHGAPGRPAPASLVHVCGRRSQHRPLAHGYHAPPGFVWHTPSWSGRRQHRADFPHRRQGS